MHKQYLYLKNFAYGIDYMNKALAHLLLAQLLEDLNKGCRQGGNLERFLYFLDMYQMKQTVTPSTTRLKEASSRLKTILVGGLVVKHAPALKVLHHLISYSPFQTPKKMSKAIPIRLQPYNCFKNLSDFKTSQFTEALLDKTLMTGDSISKGRHGSINNQTVFRPTRKTVSFIPAFS